MKLAAGQLPKTDRDTISFSERRPYLIFTSAGDFNNVLSWIPTGQRRDWDLIIAFYGDDLKELRKLEGVADLVARMKGGKFPNLHRLHRLRPDLLERYERVWVMDDDLQIVPADLDRMFAIANSYGFTVCQPAFSPDGRLSLDITRLNDSTFARIVNFVEVTCPLFETQALLRFFSVYDGVLPGWGVDWWFSQYLGAEANCRFAVVDAVVAVNPTDDQRPGGRREILRFGSDEDRWRQWRQTAEAYGLREYEHVVHAEIRRPRDSASARLKLEGRSMAIQYAGSMLPRPERPPIPRRIMQAWTSRDLPDKLAACVASVSTINPEYDHEIWDATDMSRWMARHFPLFADRFETYTSPLHRLDIVRYFWLFKVGGFYLDIDMHALRPLDAHLGDGDVVLAQLGGDPASPDNVPNAAMASRPRQEFWLYIIAGLFDGPASGPPRDTTGTRYLRHAIEQWLRDSDDQRAERIERGRALLPADDRTSEPTMIIRFLPSDRWFPLNPADPVHRFVRRRVLAAPAMQRPMFAEMFPNATLTTFWMRARE